METIAQLQAALAATQARLKCAEARLCEQGWAPCERCSDYGLRYDTMLYCRCGNRVCDQCYAECRQCKLVHCLEALDHACLETLKAQ